MNNLIPAFAGAPPVHASPQVEKVKVVLVESRTNAIVNHETHTPTSTGGKPKAAKDDYRNVLTSNEHANNVSRIVHGAAPGERHHSEVSVHRFWYPRGGLFA